MNPPPHPGLAIWGEYYAKCSFAGCPGTKIFEQGLAMNLQVGDKVPFDQTDHGGTTCPNCKRASLVVLGVPQSAPPKQPKGWAKVPEK